MSNLEKTEQQDSCRWIDPSEESLPLLATPTPQGNCRESATARKAPRGIEEPVMAGMVTISEKEYWRARIEKRVEQRVEAISAKEPYFWERLQRESRQRTLASLGLLEWQEELDAIERQLVLLENRRRQIERAMLAHVRGVATKDIEDYENHRHRREVDQAIARRQVVHQNELLSESEIGQQILKLRKGKETLVDFLWLATAPMQIQDLWSKVALLLNE